MFLPDVRVELVGSADEAVVLTSELLVRVRGAADVAEGCRDEVAD